MLSSKCCKHAYPSPYEYLRFQETFVRIQWSHLLLILIGYTYIIGHYNPSIRIIDLASHSTYVVCVNFIQKWRNLQFKVDSERQIFWETFQCNFIYSQSFY